MILAQSWPNPDTRSARGSVDTVSVSSRFAACDRRHAFCSSPCRTAARPDGPGDRGGRRGCGDGAGARPAPLLRSSRASRPHRWPTSSPTSRRAPAARASLRDRCDAGQSSPAGRPLTAGTRRPLPCRPPGGCCGRAHWPIGGPTVAPAGGPLAPDARHHQNPAQIPLSCPQCGELAETGRRAECGGGFCPFCGKGVAEYCEHLIACESGSWDRNPFEGVEIPCLPEDAPEPTEQEVALGERWRGLHERWVRLLRRESRPGEEGYRERHRAAAGGLLALARAPLTPWSTYSLGVHPRACA
jgi:hypothetical protein